MTEPPVPLLPAPAVEDGVGVADGPVAACALRAPMTCAPVDWVAVVAVLVGARPAGTAETLDPISTSM